MCLLGELTLHSIATLSFASSQSEKHTCLCVYQMIYSNHRNISVIRSLLELIPGPAHGFISSLAFSNHAKILLFAVSFQTTNKSFTWRHKGGIVLVVWSAQGFEEPRHPGKHTRPPQQVNCKL